MSASGPPNSSEYVELRSHSSVAAQIYGVAWSAISGEVAVACEDDSLRVLDPANRWRELSLSDPKGDSRNAIGAVAWSPDGRMLTGAMGLGRESPP